MNEFRLETIIIAWTLCVSAHCQAPPPGTGTCHDVTVTSNCSLLIPRTIFQSCPIRPIIPAHCDSLLISYNVASKAARIGSRIVLGD